MTHQLIASPYPEGHLVVRPGYDGGIRIGAARYAELRDAPAGAPVPAWLAEPARAGWGIDLAGRPTGDTILVRPETGYGYARASYELNLGCNYDCEHCYLGEKLFAGMDWPGRERLLQVMADAGVLWLQLTGGEPLIDPLFAETHAARLGHGDDDPDLLQRVTAGPAQDARPAHRTPALPADAEHVRGDRGVLRRDDPPPGIVPPVHARARRRPRGRAADADQHRRLQPQRPRDRRR